MATCARCGTIMPGMPGAKCPACGAIGQPLPPPPADEAAAAPPVMAPQARPLPSAIDKVALGLQLVMYAALALLLAIFVGGVHSSVAAILNIACFLLALGGVVLIGMGLGFAPGTRLLHAILMFVPLVNLLVALILVARAGKALKASGYRVGFLSVRK